MPLALLFPLLLPASRPAPYDMFSTHSLELHGNRVQCGINDRGFVCVDPSGSVNENGFWPAGTNNNYVFNEGLEIAGIITAPAGFAWLQDTVGAFFMDPRGDQHHGSALTPIYDGLNGLDLLRWPAAGVARDTALFAPSLLARNTVSDEDSWVRYWDGDPALATGRRHPMGLLVDQRTLAWNNPGMEDALFYVWRITNISARAPAVYQQLAGAGYDAASIAQVARIGARFHDVIRDTYGVTIPDSGYTIDALYAGLAQDADIGDASSNYSNENQVFGATLAWKGGFSEPSWTYDPTIFSAPFAPRPGFVADAWLHTPLTPVTGVDTTVSMASNMTGGAPFPDAVGVQRLWRNFSLNLLPTDGSCSSGSPVAARIRHFCYFAQTPSDTRVVSASGPSSLAPGQSALIVIAQVMAAPVAAAIPSNAFFAPGLPISGSRLVSGADTLRIIDRIAGWVSHSDVNGDGVIGPNEVVTTPRSLYWKIQRARALLNAHFLQPQPPDAPRAFAVPGDGRATVVWQPSATEASGDPYFAVASNPASALYDPDYRKNDVEGYRVWRGTSPTTMQMVAQFDYAGTNLTDYTGQVQSAPGAGLTCAPDLGASAGCPAFPVSIPLSGNVVQFHLGDRTRLLDSSVVILAADTAVTGHRSGRKPLTDTGVPFVFVDSGLVNGVDYYYAVTAFDVNSARSAPSTMESALLPHIVTPRASSQEQAGAIGSATLLGSDGSVLDPAAPLPTLDAFSARFSGSQPPTNALQLMVQSAAPQLLGNDTLTVTLDSVIPGSWFNSKAPAVYWFSSHSVSGVASRFSLPILGVATEAFNHDIVVAAPFPAVSLGGGASSRYGVDSSVAIFGSLSVAVNGDYRYTSQYRGLVNSDPGSGVATGPRWWVGNGNENVDDPNGINCLSIATFSCTLTDLSRNAGQLPGVGLFDIAAYGTIGTTEPVRTEEGITSGVFRAADFKWFWGSNGAVDSVLDVTHKVRVSFSPKIRASWGIINDSSFVGHVVDKQLTPDTSIALLSWGDVTCVAPAPLYAGSCGGVSNFTGTDSGAVMMNHARLTPVIFKSSTFGGLTGLSAGGSTGSGFILFLDGHFFLMQLTSLPAAGTVWNLRTYAGNITGAQGAYTFVPANRPAAVPGLRVRLTTQAGTLAAATNDTTFQHVHTIPDPYYITNALETGGTQVLRFVNLPSRAIIRIYSLSGVLVRIVTHNEPSGGGEENWDLRNNGGRAIASGVYIYHVEAPDGRSRIGRFTVVNGDH